MDARTREEIRHNVSQSRVRPHEPQRVFFSADGVGAFAELVDERPVECIIEATSANGQLAPWLTDEWWIRARGHFERRSVGIVILPTPGAILDDMLMHQLEMVRRIAPLWRMVGYATCEDARREPDLQRWLRSPYDEVRFATATTAGRRTTPEAAERLVAQAALSPRVAGTHHACLRLTHASPRTYRALDPGSCPKETAAPEDASHVRRIFDANPVEST